MSVLAEIFQAQRETPDLAWCSPSPADVTAAGCMSGLLSDPVSRWIPLAVPVKSSADA